MTTIMIDAPQGSPEWLQARAGAITASRFRDACDKTAKGLPSAKCLTYAAQVAIERISGEPADDTFVSWQMRRGTELEPEARLAYESQTGRVVEESGVILTEDRRFGYSSDGRIGDDGLIEIKCVVSAEKLITIWRDRDAAEYMHQIQGGLWLTGRKWCDLVIYAPQLAAIGKELLVMRTHRDEAFIEQLESDLLAFAARVDEHERVLREPIAEAA